MKLYRIDESNVLDIIKSLEMFVKDLKDNEDYKNKLLGELSVLTDTLNADANRDVKPSSDAGLDPEFKMDFNKEGILEPARKELDVTADLDVVDNASDFDNKFSEYEKESSELDKPEEDEDLDIESDIEIDTDEDLVNDDDDIEIEDEEDLTESKKN